MAEAFWREISFREHIVPAVALAVLVTALLVLGFLGVRSLLVRMRGGPVPMDRMEGSDFEQYCADLLAGAGFIKIQLTGKSHDFGADILAEREGVTYAVQCKRYQSRVGVHAVEEVYAGRDYYDRMVGAVMTNGYFTRDAEKMADKLHILLWDRQVIEEWEGERD